MIAQLPRLGKEVLSCIGWVEKTQTCVNPSLHSSSVSHPFPHRHPGPSSLLRPAILPDQSLAAALRCRRRRRHRRRRLLQSQNCYRSDVFPCRRAAGPRRKCIPREARRASSQQRRRRDRVHCWPRQPVRSREAGSAPIAWLHGRISPWPSQQLKVEEEEAGLSSSQSFSLPSSSSAPFIPSFVVASPSFVPAAQCPAPRSSSLLASPCSSHLAAPPHHSSLLSSSIFFSSSFSSSFSSCLLFFPTHWGPRLRATILEAASVQPPVPQHGP